jgi:hypothetical protein
MNNQPASHISSVCSSYSTHNTTGKLYAQSITNPKWKHFVVKKKVETFNPEKKNKDRTQNWLCTYVASILGSIMLPS